MLLKRARDSASGEVGAWDGGGEAGMELRTDRARSKELGVDAEPALWDANDLFRTVGADSDIGTGVLGVGVGLVEQFLLISEFGFVLGATASRCVDPSKKGGTGNEASKRLSRIAA